MDYQIRDFQKRDIDQLITLCAEHAKFENTNYSEHGKKEALLKIIESSNLGFKCLVVTDGNHLVGYTTLIRQFSTWEAKSYLYMDCLYLKEEFRGYGIGKLLLDRIKQYASEEGFNQIQWQTPAFNKKATKFYKRERAIAKEKTRFFFELGN